MLRELPSLSLNLIINTPVNLPVSESDTWWLRAQPSSWAKSGSFGPLLVSRGTSCNISQPPGHPPTHFWIWMQPPAHLTHCLGSPCYPTTPSGSLSIQLVHHLGAHHIPHSINSC